MTPVEEIRRATQLMREWAQAATPGPWSPNGYQVEPHVTGEDCGCGGGIGLEADAAHIASWHPDVALKNADLLDIIASAIGAQRIRRNGKVADGALAVARAYLGGAT